jgi:hypothetical protein
MHTFVKELSQSNRFKLLGEAKGMVLYYSLTMVFSMGIINLNAVYL